MFWRCQSVLCILLMCMAFQSFSYPLGQKGSLTFSHSLRLTRTIRARVQKLLTRYKQQMFGDELFEYRGGSILPVTVSYQAWQQMQDIERLQLASHHLQTFWSHLEDQRQLLQNEKKENRRELRSDKRGRPQATLCQSFMGLQIDLRDLMRQVNSQLESLIIRQHPHSTSTKSPPTSPLYSASTSLQLPTTHRSTESTPTHINAPRSSTRFTTESTQTSTQLSANTEKTSVGVTVTTRSTKPTQTSTALRLRQGRALSLELSRWHQHLQGYVILRDLERYLSRLARDYTVLQAKQI